jgi:hypothetical protein
MKGRLRMIYAKPGAEFEALLEQAGETGLVGTLGTRIDTTAGVEALERLTTGITEPVPGNYIVKRVAPKDDGSYLLVWDRVEGGKPLTPENVAVEQLQVTRIAPLASTVEFLPDPLDVASVLTARTYLESGEEAREFTTETRPTEGQVQTLIYQAGNEVAAKLGQEIADDTLRAYARELVAIRAAMGVELSYFPEQANSEDAVYDQLKDLYESGLDALIDALPDTSSTHKGFYSLHTRSDVAGVFPTSELLP